MNATIEKLYRDLISEAKKDSYSPVLENIITNIYQEVLTYLTGFEIIELKSKIPGKKYFAYMSKSKKSRPVNSELFEPDLDSWKLHLSKMRSKSFDDTDLIFVQKVIYSLCISFCVAVDLSKNGDQKTPGTFFEYLISFFYSWKLGVKPQKSIPVLNIDDENTSLPTDFVFNCGPNKPKFHMPIKTSTRERAIMLWAHQKLLDGVYGTERFMGTPVILAETKLSTKTNEVTEICTPDQWRLYQLYIAKLKCIYYLDLPQKYADLNKLFPPIIVKEFSHFIVYGE